jgi:6-pyruvoyl-tetrahydropterin synthase
MAHSTLFLQRFTVLDFAFLAPGQGFQGESFHVSAELEGELDAQGFILDFGPAKKLLKEIVDESLDHKLVIPNHPDLVGTAKGFRFEQLEYHPPHEAIAVVESPEITISALESFLQTEASAKLPANVKSVRFSLQKEGRFAHEPNFRYTHGLRLHQGNCQRLIHGHRNPIEVWLAGQRQTKLEEFLALEWAGAHFAHAATIYNLADLDLSLGRRQEKNPHFAEIGYESPQGEFWARFPANKVVVLEQEPSIENIARLGWQRLVAEGATTEICVVAYEGINKGASFRA